MEQTLRKIGSSIQVRLDWCIGLASVGSFFWLLSHDLLHPLVVYVLQLYLTF